MQWNDAAIILSSRKFGESSAVVRVLAREHGVFGGIMRAAMSKANRGIVAPGNVVSANWQARLSEQLGTFKLELLEPHAAHIMHDAGKLAALSSACSLIELAMPERHPYPKLFSAFHEFLHTLSHDEHWQQDYIRFELDILSESGFGLDFSECAATGSTEDLVYVSPKSARAVSRDAGLPYHDKMLPLPAFLLPSPRSVEDQGFEGVLETIYNALKATPSPTLPRAAGEGVRKSPPPSRGRAISEQTLAGLRLTGYFLENSLLAPHGKKLPAARARLIDEWNKLDG